MRHGQDVGSVSLSRVEPERRVDDPLMRWGILLAVVPFLTVAIFRAPSAGASNPNQASTWQPRPEPAPAITPRERTPESTSSPRAPATPAVSANGQTNVPTTGVPASALVVATRERAYQQWLQANPVIKDVDLTTMGTAPGAVANGYRVGFRAEQVIDLSSDGQSTHRPSTRPPGGPERARNVIDLTAPRATATTVTNTKQILDLTKLGSAVGSPPKRWAIGERREVVIDLSQRGSVLGAPPRIPTRDE